MSTQDSTGAVMTENEPFQVLRGSTLVAAQYATPPNRTPYVSGRMMHYDATGKLVAYPNVTLEVTARRSDSTTLGTMGSATTNSLGEFRFNVTPPSGTAKVTVETPDTATYAGTGVSLLPDSRQETYLDGRTAPTSTTSACSGCTMSSYGHVKASYTTGSIGPFANQKVAVQVRVNGGSTWSTVATAGPTTSTGYFMAHWPMAYSRGSVVEVRFAYLTPYQSVKSSFLYTAKFTVS